jgi:hypothetical protein
VQGIRPIISSLQGLYAVAAAAAAMLEPRECCIPPSVYVSCIVFESPLQFRVCVVSSLWFPLCYPLTSDLVEEVYDDVVLLHAQAVEVLPHDVCQLVLGLSPELFASRDCRRVEANASRLGEHPFVVIADEGSRRLQAVRSAVRVEDVSFESGPL